MPGAETVLAAATFGCGEEVGGASQGDGVADAVAVVGERREGSVGASVVDLVVGGEAHGDRVLGDVGGGARGGVGRVVGRVGAADRDPRHADGLGGADV